VIPYCQGRDIMLLSLLQRWLYDNQIRNSPNPNPTIVSDLYYIVSAKARRKYCRGDSQVSEVQLLMFVLGHLHKNGRTQELQLRLVQHKARQIKQLKVSHNLRFSLNPLNQDRLIKNPIAKFRLNCNFGSFQFSIHNFGPLCFWDFKICKFRSHLHTFYFFYFGPDC